MSALRGLAGKFTGLAAASALFAAPACAQDDNARTGAEPQPTQVAMVENTAISNNVEIASDAHFEADAWVVDHEDRLAVAVRIGTDTQVPLDRIEAVLRDDFADNGVRNVRVYFEMADASGGSAVSFHTDGYVSDFYPLANARDQVAEMARKIRFDPVFAANMN